MHFSQRNEGYERLARARVDKTSNTKSIVSELNQGKAIFSDGKQHGEQESSIWDLDPGPSAANVCTQQASPGDGGDTFDMMMMKVIHRIYLPLTLKSKLINLLQQDLILPKTWILEMLVVEG